MPAVDVATPKSKKLNEREKKLKLVSGLQIVVEMLIVQLISKFGTS